MLGLNASASVGGAGLGVSVSLSGSVPKIPSVGGSASATISVSGGGKSAARSPRGEPIFVRCAATLKDSKVDGCVFTPANKLCTAAGKEMHVWDVQSKAMKAKLPGHRGDIAGITCAEGYGLVATCSRDSTIRLWSTDTVPITCYATLRGLSLCGRDFGGWDGCYFL